MPKFIFFCYFSVCPITSSSQLELKFLTHIMSPVSFYTPWENLQVFYVFRGKERDQWHEMGYKSIPHYTPFMICWNSTGRRPDEEAATGAPKQPPLTKAFYCEFCEIFKNFILTEHVQATASADAFWRKTSLNSFESSQESAVMGAKLQSKLLHPSQK